MTGAFRGTALGLLSILLVSCTSTSEPFGDLAASLLSEAADSAEAEDASVDAQQAVSDNNGQDIAIPAQRPDAESQPLAIASTKRPGKNAVAAISAADLSSRSPAATVARSGDRGFAGQVMTNTVPAASEDKQSADGESSGGFLASLFASSAKSKPLREEAKKTETSCRPVRSQGKSKATQLYPGHYQGRCAAGCAQEIFAFRNYPQIGAR